MFIHFHRCLWQVLTMKETGSLNSFDQQRNKQNALSVKKATTVCPLFFNSEQGQLMQF